MTTALLSRLGVAPHDPVSDRAIGEALVTALEATRTDLDRFWFDCRCYHRQTPGYDAPAFDDFVRLVGASAPAAHATSGR